MQSLFHHWRQDLRSYAGDWTQQGFWALAVHRFGAWRYLVKVGPIRKIFSCLYKVADKAVQVFCGIELPCEAAVGSGTRIDHFGGVIVSGYASIGDGCVIRQGVTIGLKNEDEPCAPQIGNGVNIGAGAKLLGDITIGDGAVIGANAVVLHNVPPRHLAVGIPARIQPLKNP